MDPDRWRKIDRLFHEAVQQPPAQRVAFLDQACNGDFELRLELEALLACDRSSVGVTNLPAAVVAVNISTDHGRAESFASETLQRAANSARAADLQPGEMVSHYRINKQLGRGGMGVVYHATDSRLERDVALKFLPEDYLRDPQRLQRFQREARMASALNHPHICTVHDWHEADGRSFIVMELVQGRTLRAVAAEQPPLHVLLRLCGQVARALEAAHAAGIVHRDVKPDNIMVRPDGYVKVVDFGLARRGPSAEELLAAGSAYGSQETYSEQSVTKTGSLLGTVRYMSPEQARGEPCGSAGDMFALGIVLYELFCGVNPFARVSELETLTAILNDTPLPPASLAPNTPIPLARLIEQLLAKDPLRRPTAADGGAVLAELCGDDAGSITDGLFSAQRNRCTVGRQRERAELWKAFEGAAAGNGVVVTIAGEPGLGKTTLAEEFLGELTAQPCAIARGRCSERLAGTEAFLPILELLDSMLQGARADVGERLLRKVAPTWHAQVVSTAAQPPPSAESAPRATSQERMKREFVAFIQEIAQLRPLVLFIDDMHWADISTVDLLAYVGGKLVGLRVLLLLTFRPTELHLSEHPLLPVKLELQARGLSREVALDFLTLDDITRYLELQFAENTFSTELSAILHHRTEGNPLFMVDVVRYLRDRGVLAVQDGRWSVAQSLPDLERDLPESTRSMIQTKIEQLGEDDRRLLVAASVQGYTFDSAVAAVCLNKDATDVEERLEKLERVHAFVRQIEECELPDGTLTLRYSFVHVLYQNALHGSLRPTRRASLSRAVAETLVSFHGDQRTNIANELAVLFEAARDFPRATEQYYVAAQNALKVFAYREAVLLAERGLELLQRLSFPSERLPLALGIQLIQASALVASQGYAADATREAWQKACQFAAQVGDRRLLFAASFGLAVNHMVAEELFESRECCEQLVEMALQLQEPMLEMGARTVSGYTLEFLGEVVAAHESFERARSLHDPQQNPAYVAYYGYDPGGAAWVETSRTLAVLGYLEQARSRVEESIAWAQQTGHPLVISHAYHVSVHPYFFRGEPRRIIELAEAGLPHCDEHGLANDRGWFSIGRGWALVRLGEEAKGIAMMRDNVAALRAIRAEVAFSEYLGMLVDGLLHAGRLQEALDVLAEAFDIVNCKHDRFYEAELTRLQGEILLAQSPAAADETAMCFQRAIDIARRQQTRLFELRAAVSIARLLAGTGQWRQGRQLLLDTYSWFNEGFDTVDLQSARKLLEQLASDTATSP